MLLIIAVSTIYICNSSSDYETNQQIEMSFEISYKAFELF